jgi:hypothetical protein
MDDPRDQVKDAVFEAAEAVLEAQLRAVRALRKSDSVIKSRAADAGEKGMSQVDMAFDILQSSGPLHVKEIIQRINERFGVTVDRESLVSALSKRVSKRDRFSRVAPNTFGLVKSNSQEV